jgi:phosphoenolpyruvate phosphomutase
VINFQTWLYPGPDSSPPATLARDAFLRRGGQVGIGVHNGLSARLASRHAFDFAWVGSFEASAVCGLPDVGLLDPSEVAATVRMVRGATDLPVVVDMDAGSDDPVKMRHTVLALATAGVRAVCIEDNPVVKRSSLYAGYARVLVSPAEHARRVAAARAAADAAGGGCAVIARTEALVAGMGIDEAVARADAYVRAGADAVFVQSVDPSGDEILQWCREWDRRTAVFVTPTVYAHTTVAELAAAGATHVIYANHGIRASHHAMDRVFSALRSAPAAAAVQHAISPVRAIADEVGEPQLRAFEAGFETAEPTLVSVPATTCRT